jgi:hypothetical protein
MNQKKKKEVTISEARDILEEAEMQKRLDATDVTKEVRSALFKSSNPLPGFPVSITYSKHVCL